MRNQLLRDADWAGMSQSLEIRVPFVDRFLAEEIAPLLSRTYCPATPKQFLVSAARPELPEEIQRREKTGFAIPIKEWMRSQLPPNTIGEPWARSWSGVVRSNVYRGC